MSGTGFTSGEYSPNQVNVRTQARIEVKTRPATTTENPTNPNTENHDLGPNLAKTPLPAQQVAQQSQQANQPARRAADSRPDTYATLGVVAGVAAQVSGTPASLQEQKELKEKLDLIEAYLTSATGKTYAHGDRDGLSLGGAVVAYLKDQLRNRGSLGPEDIDLLNQSYEKALAAKKNKNSGGGSLTPDKLVANASESVIGARAGLGNNEEAHKQFSDALANSSFADAGLKRDLMAARNLDQGERIAPPAYNNANKPNANFRQAATTYVVTQLNLGAPWDMQLLAA
jgi:hypothetical protein